MKIVLKAALSRYTVEVGDGRRAEPTRRRSITFSPAGGATVVLRERLKQRATASEQPALVTA
jgi:hypothetical protein